MRHSLSYKAGLLSLTILAGTYVGVCMPAYAQDSKSQEQQEQKQSRFAGFIKRLTSSMERKLDLIDRDPSIPVEELEKVLVFEDLPDGQTLLMRPKVGRLIYDYDIYGIKKNNTLYFSLIDMIDILDLAVDFDEDTKIGDGWFLREDWKIALDLNQGKITSKGQEYSVDLDNILDENGVVFVAQEDLSRWFDMEFKADISQQYLDIASAYPLPGVAKNYRQNKNRGSRSSNRTAVLPRKKTEYSLFDINTTNVQLGTRLHRANKQASAVRRTASVAAEGQLLMHEANGVVGYNNEDGISSVVARLARRDEDPVLLGPLKARSYTIGDTSLVNVPLTGSSSQELGFRMSNNKLTNTQFETTEIDGDALPGWDVELYRNGILAASAIVDDGGRYNFTDIQLFGGENLFEVFFYGPQGEVRNKTVSIPVTQSLLNTQNNTYDVSVSFAESRTYQKNRTDDVDKDTPHIAARFNKVIGDTLTYIGVRNRDIEGENKTFLGAGFTKFFKGTIFDGNFGVDDKGSTAGQLVARKNINKWDIAASALVQDEDYAPNETTNQQVFRVDASAQRSFLPVHGKRANISGSTSYSVYADGQNQFEARFGSSLQTGKLNFSNNLSYQSTDAGSSSFGSVDERLEDAFSVRAHIGKVFLRGGVNYDILPDSKVDKYFSQISYYPTPKFSGDLSLDHDPDRSLTEARLNLNYVNKYFRTSPFIEYDNEHELYAGVNLNFSTVADPNKLIPDITSDRVIGRGLVSSFVYYDKNGNMKFDGDDEPLPEVVVESRNIRRRVQTNEKGYSLINDLPPTRATDIYVDRESLPDPYMIAGNQGVSIFASPGEIVELEFPIHLSGEIDGTVSIQKLNGTKEIVKRADLILYPLDAGRKDQIKVEAAIDGFYVASQIPPGKYLMAVSNDTSRSLRASAPVPRLVNIGYTGDTLYGYDFELQEKQVNVPLTVTYIDLQQLEGAPLDDIFYSVKTRANGGSKLLKLVGSFGGRRAVDSLFAGLTEVDWQLGEGERRFITSSNTLDEAYDKCRAMVRNATPCTMEVIVPTQSRGAFMHTASR